MYILLICSSLLASQKGFARAAFNKANKRQCTVLEKTLIGRGKSPQEHILDGRGKEKVESLDNIYKRFSVTLG